MRRAFTETLMAVAAVLLVLLLVMVVIFGRQAGIFQRSLSQEKIIQANEQCRAFTATGLRKNEQLIDTDFDEMADVCDVCPNNYLSAKGDEVNTDRDVDGLSEEGLNGLRSPYNRGEYVVNLCDKEFLSGKQPQCANDWDDVRGKCKCTPGEIKNKETPGFYKDRCASPQEWDAEKEKYIRPLIDSLLGQVIGLASVGKYREALTRFEQAKREFESQGFAVYIPPYIAHIESLASFKTKRDGAELTEQERDVLQRLSTIQIETRPDPDFMHFLRSAALIERARFATNVDDMRQFLIDSVEIWRTHNANLLSLKYAFLGAERNRVIRAGMPRFRVIRLIEDAGPIVSASLGGGVWIKFDMRSANNRIYISSSRALIIPLDPLSPIDAVIVEEAIKKMDAWCADLRQSCSHHTLDWGPTAIRVPFY